MAREIKCKDCSEPFGSVWALTQHKIDVHGAKKKRRKKKVDTPPQVELTDSQLEAQLMENVIGWFEDSTLPAATHERIINYLHARYAAPDVLGAA
jgi:hypothetical protein